VTSVAESIATACAARSIRNIQTVGARNNRATNPDIFGQNRSEPSSRRASSSSEDELAGFCTNEIERAILESVQLASERDVIDLTDDQVDQVAGAEAGAASGGARPRTVASAEGAGPRTVTSAEGARPRTVASAEGARPRTGTSSTASSVLRNADTFLDALQRVVVGSDFEFDMDTSEASQHPDARRSAIFTAMTSMGIGEPVRRLIDRLLSIDTLGGPVGGPNAVSHDEGSFVSLAMVKERLIEQGESRTKVSRLLTSLKNDAINL